LLRAEQWRKWNAEPFIAEKAMSSGSMEALDSIVPSTVSPQKEHKESTSTLTFCFWSAAFLPAMMERSLQQSVV